MAKVGNKGTGAVNNAKGPCEKCGETEQPFFAVKVFTSTGRKSMKQRCEKCHVKV